MTTGAQTVPQLLELIRPDQALCAFNVENFDTLKPALWAAADVGCPVVLSFTVPAARYLGYEPTARIVGLLAAHYDVRYALHLDHCESADEIRQAVGDGFTSANFLDEGAVEVGRYLPTARALHREFAGRASLEFVLGTLGHIDDTHRHGTAIGTEHDTPPLDVSVARIAAFAQACEPDIVGFECGSLHGMRERGRELDLDLIHGVSRSTGLPIVLHGSSGVLNEALQAGIDAGVRKVNIETAIRSTYMDTVRRTVAGDGDGARKPRYLTRATDAALREAYVGFLTSYTLREI